MSGVEKFFKPKTKPAAEPAKPEPVKAEPPAEPVPIKHEAPWIDIAKIEKGIKEVAGRKHNPRIVEYHKSVKDKEQPDEVPWCSSFVNWCMEAAGYKGTESRAARSWLKYGQQLDQPRYGCIVIFWRGSKDGWEGHVGFYLGETHDKVLVLGGNQANSVSEEYYSKGRLLGYVWPTFADKQRGAA